MQSRKVTSLGVGEPAAALMLICAVALGCSTEESAPVGVSKASAGSADPAAKAAPVPPADPKALAEKGRQYYLSSCIACHNADPAIEGALGPPVAGSGYDLIEARVMRGEYPAGYTPKRDTRVMLAMPFLEKQLPALAAYLAPAT